MRWIAGAVIAAAAIAAACGGSDGNNASGPATALRTFFEQADRGQWGRQWDTLHPAQQALIRREAFVTCRTADLSGFSLEDLDIVETFGEPTVVPGTDLEVERVAVTFALEGAFGLLTFDDRDTAQLVLFGEKWTWLMRQETVDAYQRGECP